MDQPTKKGSGGQHNSASLVFAPGFIDNAAARAIPDKQIADSRLNHLNTCLGDEHLVSNDNTRHVYNCRLQALEVPDYVPFHDHVLPHSLNDIQRCHDLLCVINDGTPNAFGDSKFLNR